MNKFNKFILMTVVACLSFSAFSESLSQKDNYEEQIQEKINLLKQDGYIPKKINFSFNFINENKISSKRVNAEALLNVAQETCNVKVEVSPNMKVGISGSHENIESFKSIIRPQNEEQEKLRTDYVIRHEASHCKLYEIKDVYMTGNSDIDKILNQYFKFSGASYQNSNYGDSSIYLILHENFADVNAFVQMIKEYGPTPDLLKTIQQVQIERSEAAAQNNKNGITVHNTEISLKEILKEENIKIIMGLQNSKEIQDFSLKISNIGMWQTLRNYKSSNVINAESLENGVMKLVGSLMSKDLIGKTEQSNISINWENNLLFEIANNSYKEFKVKHDTTLIKTKEQFNDFYQDSQQELRDEIVKNIDKYLTDKNSINIFNVINQNISLISKTPNLTVKEIKEQGIKDIEVIADMAIKFKNNKPNTLSKENEFNNISQIKTAVTNQSNHKLSIKKYN